MFGLVAKMLIDKDPSLEVPIQSSLRENLRDIGKRCVDAMEKFVEGYDSLRSLAAPSPAPFTRARMERRSQSNGEKTSNRSTLLSRFLNC